MCLPGHPCLQTCSPSIECVDHAGNPKGVVLTHYGLITAVASLGAFCKEANIPISQDDNHLSYLTLAHILDRIVEEFALSVGAHIGYWQVGNAAASRGDAGAACWHCSCVLLFKQSELTWWRLSSRRWAVL